jgi:hypothetical protein
MVLVEAHANKKNNEHTNAFTGLFSAQLYDIDNMLPTFLLSPNLFLFDPLIIAFKCFKLFYSCSIILFKSKIPEHSLLVSANDVTFL